MEALTALKMQLVDVMEYFRALPVAQQWTIVGFVTFVWWTSMSYYNEKRVWGDIPVIGSTPFTRWLSPFKYLFYGNKLVQEGYSKYSPGIFRIKQSPRWMVYVTSSKMIEEIRKYPDNILSNIAAINEDLETEWTFGKAIAENMYHVPIIRDQLTKNLAPIFPSVIEEMAMAFDHYIKATADDWLPVKATETLMKIVCRSSNRAFITTPVCRNEEYIDINIKFTIDVFLGATILKRFPEFLKPFARRYVTSVLGRKKLAAKHLVPVIEERYELIKEHGRKADAVPVRIFLTWLIDDAEGIEKDPLALCNRILAVNAAAIHTTSLSFTTVLYLLASYGDEYAEPLREEALEVIQKEGWTKTAMTKCRKMDSFIKESFRIRSLGSVSMQRMVMEPVTLSDGSRVPRGAVIIAVSTPLHKDPKVYGPTADEFDGFRFSNIRSEKESEAVKHQAVSTSSEYLSFGYGKHACPGRFFAVNEMKAMLAHILLNYDVKFPPELGLKRGELPATLDIGHASSPNQTTLVLFRKRDNAMSAI